MFKKELITEWKKLKKNFNKNIDIGFKYWIIGLFFMVISNIILNKIFPGSTSNNETEVQNYIKHLPVLAIITTSILGPFVEEIAFRKVFKNIFKNPIIFILVSSLIFGLVHVLGQANNLADFLYFIPYTALGASFALMYIKSDTFYTSYTMHFIHNFALTLISIVNISL